MNKLFTAAPATSLNPISTPFTDPNNPGQVPVVRAALVPDVIKAEATAFIDEISKRDPMAGFLLNQRLIEIENAYLIYIAKQSGLHQDFEKVTMPYRQFFDQFNQEILELNSEQSEIFRQQLLECHQIYSTFEERIKPLTDRIDAVELALLNDYEDRIGLTQNQLLEVQKDFGETSRVLEQANKSEHDLLKTALDAAQAEQNQARAALVQAAQDFGVMFDLKLPVPELIGLLEAYLENNTNLLDENLIPE